MLRVLPERIETARLCLRKPRLADAANFFECYTRDPLVARYTTWQPHSSPQETVEFITECIRAWDSGSRLTYVLTERNVDEGVGTLEARVRGPIVDIGYVLARPLWGKGLMAEAIRAVVEAALLEPGLYRVQATCDVENLASIRVLEKSGFLREGRLERHTIHPNLSAEPRACFMYARTR